MNICIQYQLFFVIILTYSNEASCIKVRNRLLGVQGSARAIIPYFGKKEYEDLEKMSTITETIKNALFDRLNMTIEYGNELENIGSESGDCNMTTGKYNGLLGALQRNETDVTPYFFIRTDALACDENLTAGSVFLSGDFVIISHKILSSEQTTDFDLLSFLSQMDTVTYMYLLIILIITIVLITIKECADEHDEGKKSLVQTFIRSLCRNVWNFYDLCLSQEGSYIKASPIGILWFLILVFIVYYTFMFVLLNFMTTERLVRDPVQKIDDTNDLFDMMKYPEQMKNSSIGRYQPIIFHGFDPDDIFTKAIPGSNLDRIWNAALGRSDLHLKMNMKDRGSSMQFTTGITDRLVSREIVIVYNSYLYPWARTISCAMDSLREKSKTLHCSEPISAGINVHIINKNTPTIQKRYIEYALRNIHEFRLFESSISNDFANVASQLLPGYSVTKGIVCEDEKLEEEDGAIEPVGMKSYINMFQICGIIFFLSFVILTIEKIASKFFIVDDKTDLAIQSNVSNIEDSFTIVESFDANLYNLPPHTSSFSDQGMKGIKRKIQEHVAAIKRIPNDIEAYDETSTPM